MGWMSFMKEMIEDGTAFTGHTLRRWALRACCAKRMHPLGLDLEALCLDFM